MVVGGSALRHAKQTANIGAVAHAEAVNVTSNETRSSVERDAEMAVAPTAARSTKSTVKIYI